MLRYETLSSYRVVVFDLDNTLYDEYEYLSAAYADIGRYVAKKTRVNALIYEHYLLQVFQKEGRYDLFDKFISHFNLTQAIRKSKLLDIQRSCNKELKAYEDKKKCIVDLLQAGHTVYILTNGNVSQQRNKIEHLDILDLLSKLKVVYANEFIPKPSPFCLNEIIRNEKIETKDIVFIGDSKVDEETAIAAKIDFIYI